MKGFRFYSRSYTTRLVGKVVEWNDCGYVRTATVLSDGKGKRAYLSSACNPYADTVEIKYKKNETPKM